MFGFFIATGPIYGQDHHARRAFAAQEALGKTAFAAAFEDGRAMSWEQAVAYALEAPNLLQHNSTPSQESPSKTS